MLVRLCLSFALSIFLMKRISDADYDPVKAARDERKERVTKNEKQRLKNMERAGTGPSKDERKHDIEKTLASTRISTASMGK